MALNHPSTIVERLRRLTIKDASKSRKWAGRLSIMMAGIFLLPMTATVVPVFAEDSPKLEKSEKPDTQNPAKTGKTIIIRSQDDKPATITVVGDKNMPSDKMIKSKITALRLKQALEEGDVEKTTQNAEESVKQAEKDADIASHNTGEVQGDVEQAVRDAELARRKLRRYHVISVVKSYNLSPNIHVTEMRTGCKNSKVVSRHSSSANGQIRATVSVIICGKTQALQGLKDTHDQLRDNSDIPETTRQSIINSLQQQIERIEKEHNNEN
jgi:bla regulator protein blaR1